MLKLEINIKESLILIGLIVGLSLLYNIKDILLLFFIAIIFTSALNPVVSWLENKKIPRAISILGILVSFVFSVVLIGYILVPPLINQLERLAHQTPLLLDSKSLEHLGFGKFTNEPYFKQLTEQSLSLVVNSIKSVSENLLQFGFGIFGALLSAVTVIVLTFYLLLDHNKIKAFLIDLLPKKQTPEAEKIFLKAENKLGVWVRGQLFVMFLVGLFTFIGLILFGIDFALALAIIAGLLEIIPFVGPTISAIPAIIIASNQSSFHVIAVLFLYTFIQQIEGNIIIPKVMNQAVGLNPIVVILAVMIGASQGGPLMALLAIPATALGMIFWEVWRAGVKKAS